MGIRETLNQNPGITTGVTAGIILLALVFIVYQFVGQTGPKPQTKMYYTTDDTSEAGALAAMFPDDISKLAPFDHNGKQAYRIYVYSLDGGKTKFVSHLERYKADAKAKLEKIRANPPGPGNPPQGGPPMMLMQEVTMTGTEVKKPGNGPWVSMTNPQAYQSVVQIQPPAGGKLDNLEPVLP